MGARQSKTPGPVVDISSQAADVSNQEVDVSSVAVDVSSQVASVEPRDSRPPQEIAEPSRTTSIFSCCSSLPTVAKPTPVVVPENKDTEVAANPENKDSDVGSQDPALA